MSDHSIPSTVYRDEEGKPWVLPVVRTVEQQMAADETLNKEYLSIDGHKGFSDSAMKLVLGSGSKALVENRVSVCDPPYLSKKY